MVAAFVLVAGLVFCPVCQEQGLKSKVFPGVCSSTLMGYQPYYDEDGKWVDNDPNTTSCSHRCSRGHTWDTVTQGGETRVVIGENIPTAGD